MKKAESYLNLQHIPACLVLKEPTFISEVNLGEPEFQRILRSDQDQLRTNYKDITECYHPRPMKAT